MRDYNPCKILNQLLDKTIDFAWAKKEKYFSYDENSAAHEEIWQLRLAKKKHLTINKQLFPYLAVQGIFLHERFRHRGIGTNYFSLIHYAVFPFGLKGICVEAVHTETLWALLIKLGWRERDQNFYSPEMQKLIEW